MRKKIFLALVAMASLTLTSCQNKIDRALDKYEDLADKCIEANKAIKNGDLEKTAEFSGIADECKELEKELNEDEMTPEQKKRYQEISLKVIKESF
ncbi:MAG: hypothetical protein J5905_05795 [Prevotella sp.]|jgi:hypothetical protein|nr:hypothetical protein [Prevotella sp.]